MQTQHYNIEQKGDKGQHLYLNPKGTHKNTLIFMHGLGDTAKGYLDIFTSQINPVTPDTKVVLLTAPIRKVTVNFGMQMTSWFDFREFDIQPEHFDKAISVEEIVESTKMVNNVLTEEISILKDSKKVFIGGFSQGACMALHTGLQFDQQLGGILVFSGFAFPVTKQHEKNQNTKILITHGKDDQLLPWNKCEKTYKDILKRENDIKVEPLDNLDHGFNEQSFKLFKDFFNSLVK
ncbi:hypothetical protein PPERSA_07524 [Pseudocohnilembus persalinus]|uniref:Phospholipase/carboxylesterase/thioesterase domain-containing protein n=1 Tax=Pseudocohnilembus persalinus TaxID=266149 RepID=A0A0V0QZV8_PSEPJ|nr:hypothetical protein PPERSA_07524 [Pseudocohnilembus persalinus]|eukprot:KRX07774.1 hypothetical protein PPERSA_07524 [Pseudocohnilembus persalinus]